MRKKTKRKVYEKNTPVMIAALKATAIRNLAAIRTEASIHALIGESPEHVINSVARLLFITHRAADIEGMDNAEMRVIHGAASAAGDLFAMPSTLEQHRGALRSGLMAVDRLWPKLSQDSLILAYGQIEAMLANPDGLKLSDFEPG
jgi:hypothetical protein